MKKNANDRVFLCGGVFFVSRSSREFLELLTQRIRANGYFGFFCLSLHGYLSAYVDMTYFSAFHPLLLGNFVEEKDLDKQETKDALTMSISPFLNAYGGGYFYRSKLDPEYLFHSQNNPKPFRDLSDLSFDVPFLLDEGMPLLFPLEESDSKAARLSSKGSYHLENNILYIEKHLKSLDLRNIDIACLLPILLCPLPWKKGIEL